MAGRPRFPGTSGCSDDDSRTECAISCSDEFHTTRDGTCDIAASIGLAIVHGSCTQSEHR